MSGKQTSGAWLHFSEVDADKKVKCLYCSQKLSVANKSTCGLIRHLKKKHPTQQISRQTLEQTSQVQIPTASTTKRTLNSENAIPSTSTAQESTAEPLSESTCQAKISKTCNISEYFLKPLSVKKQKEIDRQLVAMIAKEYHPFSVVEDPEFKKLIHLLNPSYKLPTRKTVSHSLIPTTYNETVEIVQQRLNRSSAVCLTMDGWTSRSNDGFYSVTAHYIVEEEGRTFLASDLLGCDPYSERHTGDNISNKIKAMIMQWNLTNKVTAIVTDNASNMKMAIRVGGWRHWGCFAHSLNLATQSGLKEKNIQVVTEKIKAIVRFFNKSSHAYAQLKETQERMGLPVLKLKNDVPTRWNSTYDMIQRVLAMKKALISTAAIINSNGEHDAEAIQILTNEEWIVAEQSMEVLSMFDIVTTTISAEKNVTLSSLIIYYKRLVQHLKSIKCSTLMHQVDNLLKKLLSELAKRFGDIEDNELITQATILDPRFKKFGFNDEHKYKRAVEGLYRKVTNFRVNTDVNTEANTTDNSHAVVSDVSVIRQDHLNLLWKDFDTEVQKHLHPTNPLASAIVEVDKYLDEPLLARISNQGIVQDPLSWWHQRRFIYPRLYQLMKRRLCITATSVPCERIFSHAGQVVNERRERLKTNKISQVIFLNYNLDNKD